MTLAALLQQALSGLAPAGDLEPAARLIGQCAAVVHDSRVVVPGCVFVALRGQRADGAAYAAQAVAAGAAAVVAEEALLVAKAVCTVITVVDPELVVLGGGIGQAPGFLEAVTKQLRQLAPVMPEVGINLASCHASSATSTPSLPCFASLGLDGQPSPRRHVRTLLVYPRNHR